MTNSEIQAGDSATDRLAKLLPAEVTAAYVSIRSVVETLNRTGFAGGRLIYVMQP